jgi:cyanophycin synthetase
MKILEVRVMRGPNFWSNYRKKLIVLKLDLEKFENLPSNKIDGFADRLEQLIPSLYSHECSPGVQGGFLKRVREGTWMGHVVEHVALELQSLAGMETGFGRTRETSVKGIYNVVFSYVIEKAGVYAGRKAVELVASIANGETVNLEETIAELSRIYRKERFGPSTQFIIDEAVKRNIPVTRLNEQSLVMFGHGVNQKIISATIAGTTSYIGVDLAGDKARTKNILKQAYVPVPDGELIDEENDLAETIENIGFPLAIKPLDGNHGRGISTNITSYEQAVIAFHRAQKISSDVIVEKFIQGNDYRFIVIDFKLVAVAKRIPAMVMGNGKSTIRELIDETNKDPRRGDGHENILTKIIIDEVTLTILDEKNLTLSSILPLGEILFLKDAANISAGGTACDLTDKVHPHNIQLAERVARLLNLNICGIDIIAEDINIPITRKNGAVLEVNAAPGFRMHHAPVKGYARNVAGAVMEMLYPDNAPARIPIIAVTGTNGKTTVVRLISHMEAKRKACVGFTTTDGIYIKCQRIYEGDCSGPESARVVLRDPGIEVAVLECARGGILRSGLGFDQCDIGIVTNVSEDHIGLNGIENLNDLAKTKMVVPRSVHRNGYAILNADDDLVYEMRLELDCNIALWSMDPENKRIKRHCERGGLAAVIEKNHVTICKGYYKTRIAKVAAIPLAFEGTAELMIKNILPAVLSAVIRGFTNEEITDGLMSFIPSPELTPGRMNLFRFRNFNLMLDYSHNTDAFGHIKKYISTVNASVKTGIVAGTGDRRDEDIRNVGRFAAEVFDEIIIRHDEDSRGRTNEEIDRLIKEGVHSVKFDLDVKVISDELEAIHYAVNHAQKNAFIFVCVDKVNQSLEFIKQLLDEDLNPHNKLLVPTKNYNA